LLQDEDIQTLVEFGLTNLQAEVYLTLAKMGISTIRRISEESGLVRQEIQRVTTELHRLGLVEKFLVTPTQFRSIPIRDALSFLLGHKEKSLQELEEKAVKLLRNFKVEQREPLIEEQIQYTITSGKESIVRKSKVVVERTTKSCDIINGYWKNISYAGRIYKEQNISALKRRVRIRIVAEKLPNESHAQKIYKHSILKPGFEIRFVPHPTPAILGIYDERELLVFTSPNKLIGESPMLWTNDPALIISAQAYFDKLWKEGKPLEKLKPDVKSLRHPHKKIVQVAV
jgi:sugar-specific transcriptional regulator TrmB